MTKRNITTVRTEDGWGNRRDNASRLSKSFDTQSEAIAAAKVTAQREKLEHRIQGRDGKIREANSYGNDPHPPKAEFHNPQYVPTCPIKGSVAISLADWPLELGQALSRKRVQWTAPNKNCRNR